MPHIHRVVYPGRKEGIVVSELGKPLNLPDGWTFLPSGDATITKSVKAKGPTWVVQEKKGRRLLTRGLWANASDILASQQEVAAKRSTQTYTRRRGSDLARRATKQQRYIEEFFAEVIIFLDFHPRYHNEAEILAGKVTDHATPIGSGTVARTERIPVAKRAEAAVIAWMRHATTAYDSMRIERIKGRRREVRRHLAAKSIALLQAYRLGHEVTENCPLKKYWL
ncbi:MAG: DUF2293 domain-containing protein [Proteobacteria bacterium]|nr:DUF2293 domain-containing protein [Pseudomonadota bacterium]MBU1685748.1 DUF2293 domain-containing protein [Pseudomonadota bacterium]